MILAPWHALLAPLPADAVPRRQPVASAEILATPEGAAIAGWEQLTIDLTAGAAGLRHVLVVIDAQGRLVSANDGVLYCIGPSTRGVGSDPAQDAVEGVMEFHHESIGGRFEEDGSFRGTRWNAVTVERVGEAEPETESTPSAPSEADVAGLKSVVAEVMRRAGLRAE